MLINALAKSSRSSRMMLSAVVVVILLAAAYNWLLAPHTTYLHAAQQYGTVAGDVATKNKIIRSKIAAKKKELDKLNNEFAEFEDQLFGPQNAKEFFTAIEAIGNKTNCTISSINFLSKKPKVAPELADDFAVALEKSAVVSFAGSYSGIINFLAELVDRPQKVIVHSLTMTVPNYQSSQLDCDATFTIYVIEDKEIPANE